MQDSNPIDDFINQITAITEKNIANEQFGVTELAEEMNMSRSNLLRKIKKQTNLSVSQWISQVRLKRGMELLKTTSLNVSEVSHQVGFNSTSYFIKCFREYFGYPPGEVGRKYELESLQGAHMPPTEPRSKRKLLIASIIIAIGLTLAIALYLSIPTKHSNKGEKALVVLPFINDSNDSTNVYLINGLMEATLNNLQKIENLKVISRTSAEKYRKTNMSIPEMARELDVNYFVEGSGQKIGDQILLNIQLIDGATDKHLWSRQYRRQAKDIFALQQEIAKNIAEEIQVVITPEVERQIRKNPTENLEAYDFYLKGRELFYQGGSENLERALIYFAEALKLDNQFALVYAETAMVYYYLDMFKVEKKYADKINSNADKALLFDAKLENSLVAKAIFYIQGEQYDLAVPYLEKALAHNPNSVLAISFLGNIYNYYIPNTTKYLEYALKAARLDIAAHDSATTSNNYLRLADALIQTGFVDDALKYTDKSITYNPSNFYAKWIRVFIVYAKNRNLAQARETLLQALNQDVTQLIIAEEIGKVSYLMEDYATAYKYYIQFLELRDARALDIFKNESLKIGIVYEKAGDKEKAAEFVEIFKTYAENDRSIYKHLNLAGYYAYRGDAKKSIDHLKLFSKEENLKYWILLFPDDPVVYPIRNHPEFKQVMKEIEAKFWKKHEEIKLSLTEKGVL